VTRVEPAGSLVGHIAVPGDKSISHRAVLIGALSDGETHVRGLGRSADTQSTIDAVRAVGVQVDDVADDELVVHGAGLRGLQAPDAPIDAGNAGTLMRLLPGILAGQQGRFELTGDESLRSRPMDRVAEPLKRMGARIETTNGKPPVTVEGTDALKGIEYVLPMASAQVKSAILLAGLNANGTTTVVEPAPTRDHTELMLDAAGARVRRRPASVSIEPAGQLRLPEVVVPGDFSAAAPFIVAATLIAGSELTIHDVGLNPRRTGLLDVLERMGARVIVFNRRKVGGELIGDLEVHSAELTATDVTEGEVPRLVDERDREHRVRRRRDARRVARRRVDLDPLEGCPRRRPQGLESLRRATPVVGEPEPEHAQVVIRSCRDCGEVLSIQAQGGHAPRLARAWPAGS